MKRLPWIDILALVPALLLVFATGHPTSAMAQLDPLVVFRLLVLLWVLVHTYFIAEHMLESLFEVRDLLRNLEQSNAQLRGLELTGRRVFRWSLARLAQIAVRTGWPTALLAVLVIAVNTTTWLVLAGWRPEFLRPWLGP